MKKRILAMFLLLVLLGTAIAGCSEGTQNTDDKTETPAATPEVTGTEGQEETELSRADVKDDLPDDLNYNGQSLNILGRSKAWFDGELYVEELNGETLNDAVFNRDISVENRLNVTIDYTLEGDTNAIINKNVTAGADEYAIHVGSAVDTVQYGVKGNYYNLLGEYPEYLNLSQPWWSQYYTEQGSVGGKVFFALGDLFTSRIKLAFVTYVNMQMITDYGFENPYEIVRAGEWTFDKEMEMATQVYTDKNMNGKEDDGDVYGMSMGGMIGLDVYWSAFDLTICSKDENDIPSFNVDVEKMSAVIDKLYTYYIDNKSVFTPLNNSDGEQDVIAQMLSENRMLFSPLRIMHTDQIRDMESVYGLIPLPKWNVEQEHYYTFLHDQYSIGGIPVSVQDPSMTSAVLEALASESYRYVTPAYYDLVLNGKYLRDRDSSEMLEIAMDGIKIDFGWIHTYSLSSCSQALIRDILYNTKSNNFTSVFASRQKMYAKVMSKLIENVDKIDH